METELAPKIKYKCGVHVKMAESRKISQTIEKWYVEYPINYWERR